MSVSPPSSVTKTSPCWKGLIVPGSTLMYGSSLRNVMSRPRFSRRAPMLAEASPFPRELTTPPVTKMYFVFLERMGTFHVPRMGRDVNVDSRPRRSTEGDAGLGGGRRQSAALHRARNRERHHTLLVPDERVTLLPQWISRRQPPQPGLHLDEGVLPSPDEQERLLLVMASGPKGRVLSPIEGLEDPETLVEQLAPWLERAVDL